MRCILALAAHADLKKGQSLFQVVRAGCANLRGGWRLSFAHCATYQKVRSPELDSGSKPSVSDVTIVKFFVLAVITTISERKHIICRKERRWRIITNLFTFPLFMMTYIPICIAALFKKVEWVPTKHTVSISMDQINAAENS